MRVDRWQNLLNAAELVEAGAPREADAALARRVLDNVLEVFPSGLDPVEDLEGYAVRRLALALRRALEGG